ncbi:MAG: ribonuclease H-like domain-containing protein [bacterium]
MSDSRERMNRIKSAAPPSRRDLREDLISGLRTQIDRIMNKPVPERKGGEGPWQGSAIEAIIPGHLHTVESSEIFVARQGYDAVKQHGNIRLEDIYHISLDMFAELGVHPDLHGVHPDETVFVDTETTGLSGGTGTYAFMVGIGFFEQGEFVVEQFLMLDQAEEREMLTLLRERLSRFKYLVSFNGKSFDLPLLEARFILSRLSPDVLALPHLDLLYPARRIWKRSLDSCRLSNLERELLGLERVDDVPGELIPEIYFQYLQTRDPTRLERVFYHNRLDILTLVTLTILVHRMITDHTASCRRDGMEHYSLGRIHLDGGRFDEAAACFVSALEACAYSEREWEILKYLSLTYKRSGRDALALKAWRDMVAIDPRRETFPLIELAKHYEHNDKDYDLAAEYASKALGIFSISPEETGEIEHRLRRLQKKREM